MEKSNQNKWPFKYSVGDVIKFATIELTVWAQFVGRHPDGPIKGAYLLGDAKREKEGWYSAEKIDGASTKGNGGSDPPPGCPYPPGPPC